MSKLPSFSIVINTDGRAESLAVTLESLRFLDYPRFEVCVVRGPTYDGTAQLLAAWEDQLKTAECPERNLSISRNIGIAMAAGEVVAFIDDDAIPEAEWLRDLAPAFCDKAVGGAGGVVYDHTGTRPQYVYSSVNRLGRASWTHKAPMDTHSFPFSNNFPYVQGTNAAFRRSVLEEIGGFDEEYEFYLDETDVCCRVIDSGFLLRQLPNAIVHHKLLPSASRNESRVTRDRYAVIKNKIYFSLINNRGHHSLDAVIRDAVAFTEEHDRDIRFHIEGGRLSSDDLVNFWKDVERAWEVGLARGLSGKRRLVNSETLARYRSAYLEFPRPEPLGHRRVYCFLSSEYPPATRGGIGRYTHQLARSIATLGHHVHVLTAGAGHDRVDFEQGVWVHRLLPRTRSSLPQTAPHARVPQHIWDHAATMLLEVEAIDRKRHVECVHAPIWDCEGIAVLLDKRFPLVTSLETTLHFWLDSQTQRRSDLAFMTEFVRPMLGSELRILAESDGIHTISKAITADISKAYGIDFIDSRLALIPLGLEDWSLLPVTAPPAVADGTLRILFVGRLEARKGIDVLLAAMRHLMPTYSQLHLDIVGNDTLPGPEGPTYGAVFKSDPATEEIRTRVCFHGEVDENKLRGFYRACDIFVAPSRFESFGLVLIEAMMFSKPVIACRAGGMVETVEDGSSGLLAEPGNVTSLCECLERLIVDPKLRTRLGTAGRTRYERKFTAERMTSDLVAFLDRVAAAHGGRRVVSEKAGVEA
jgi:glycogen(starch) synthase